MEAADFWNDAAQSTAKMKELKSLKDDVSVFSHLQDLKEEIETYITLGYEENDPELLPEIASLLQEFDGALEDLRMKTLLSDEYDDRNAIVSLHAGAGGTESCDWVSILYRMYTRWAASRGYEVEVLDYLDGDEAGIKSVTFQVNGPNAYGYLKSEKGVHRLVRISPFNAAGKRQTSFASCDVINKTSSAIRITHYPTGIVVQCQNERSQHMNKDKAMQMLKAKLYLLQKEEQEREAQGIRGEVTDIGWGNQIRSYVLQPYTMVKDLRTGEETGNVDAVLDGEITPFMNAYLKWCSLGCPDRHAQDS